MLPSEDSDTRPITFAHHVQHSYTNSLERGGDIVAETVTEAARQGVADDATAKGDGAALAINQRLPGKMFLPREPLIRLITNLKAGQTKTPHSRRRGRHKRSG